VVVIRSYECQVFDVSAGGAKLVADIDAIVGTSFRLSVAPRSLCADLARSFGEEVDKSA
jgi:hypothetical protein